VEAMNQYNVILSTNESTVLAEYKPQGSRSDAYQSEAELEQAFIKQLCEQGYEYLNIHNVNDLKANIRIQLEKLNKITFTDEEWKRFFDAVIAKANESIEDKSRKLQEEYIQSFKRDDGTTKNITLINKTDIHSNHLQVINQYEENSGNYNNRYDVTILVNGLPLVHIELKRRGVPLKEAFNQIDRYQRDSFWAESGLYEYVQIFVISNGTNTKYYSNTTRFSAIREHNGKRIGKRTSNSFEFTSFWADAKNKVIPDLVDFTKTFFAKHTILNIIIKYCIFTSEKLLLVMRPYQIVATESIINKIKITSNYHKEGTIDAGGYIWHTTGSGKTLTSFKTAQLASKLDDIDKVLFVVDRKDLDYQTMKEYDRFEKGAANGNKNTKTLQRQLEDKDKSGAYHSYKIIVTTIQKLDVFIAKNPHHDIYNKHIVIIFDECHRSQFGDMHRRIIKYFKKYHIFGFTGTPIFADNSSSRGNPQLRTTEQAFGDKLHTYTIVDAINDGNVLPFRIDYINTVRKKDKTADSQVEAIDDEAALLDSKRISEIVKYIIEHFDQKTKRNTGYYDFNKLKNIEAVARGKTDTEEKIKQKLNGFNSIFAVSSITAAKLYYTEFKKQLSERFDKDIKIAIIYSYAQNEAVDENGFMDDENSDSTEGLDQSSRDFLEMAINDYNAYFNTAYDTSPEKFPNYYKDLSLRMKNKEIDILIVVNMFLTGFDATTLNTLWVDKNLKMHGLIQAYSRTNRILNSVKTYGNIVCFRNLQKETDEAIALFGDKEACGMVLLKPYADYFSEYKKCVEKLEQKYPLGKQIVSENAEKDFIRLVSKILRLRNILTSFDEFSGNEILKPIDFQDYTGMYNDLYDKYRIKADKTKINDDIIFEMELVRQIEVNIDYILMLVAKYHQSNCKDKQILANINRAIKSSLELRSKKELIEGFISKINSKTDVQNDWKKFIDEQREIDLQKIINDEHLKPDEARQFITQSFKIGEIKTTGSDISNLMCMSRFKSRNRPTKKQSIVEKFKSFFEKYLGLGIPDMTKKKDINKN